MINGALDVPAGDRLFSMTTPVAGFTEKVPPSSLHSKLATLLPPVDE